MTSIEAPWLFVLRRICWIRGGLGRSGLERHVDPIMTMCSSMTRWGTIHVRVGWRPLAMAVASVPRRAGGSFRASTLHGRWTYDWFVSPATWRRSWSARDRRSTRFRTSHRWLKRGWMGEAHLLNRTFLREEDLRTMRCSHRSFILQPPGNCRWNGDTMTVYRRGWLGVGLLRGNPRSTVT